MTLMSNEQIKDLCQSFFTEEESIEAEKQINEYFGNTLPRTLGYFLLIEPYVQPQERKIKGNDGKDLSIYLPDSSMDLYRFTACVGRVLKQGPDVYQDPKLFRKSYKWCRVGDWVVYPRNEGHRITIDGKDLLFLSDNSIIAIVEDPSIVTRGS